MFSLRVCLITMTVERNRKESKVNPPKNTLGMLSRPRNSEHEASMRLLWALRPCLTPNLGLCQTRGLNRVKQTARRKKGFGVYHMRRHAKTIRDYGHMTTI